VYAWFTERARLVVVLAHDAARELGCRQVGTEHVLLGLLAEGEGLGAWALESLGLDLERVRAAVVRIAGRGDGPRVGQVPFTWQAKCVIELANVEVDRRRLSFVGTEHVLLGLLDQVDADPDGDVALLALIELNVTSEQIRMTAERFVPERGAGLSWMLRRAPGVEFRGVRGAGWIDVLSLQPEVHLRRVLVRAAVAAMDDERAVIELRDLLAAFGHLREGAEMLSSARVIAPDLRPSAAAEPPVHDWTRIDAGDHVLAAVMGAQRRAREDARTTVALDDLLLTLATEQAGLLSRSGWEVSPLRSLLEQRRQHHDPG
jgi:ATP-dependent Clp protease ATP-binding subunit ClpA